MSYDQLFNYKVRRRNPMNYNSMFDESDKRKHESHGTSYDMPTVSTMSRKRNLTVESHCNVHSQNSSTLPMLKSSKKAREATGTH